MKVLLIAAFPITLSILAQAANTDDSRIFDTLLQIPYVIAFGWFVLRLADKQEKFIRDTLEIILILCDEKNRARPETLNPNQHKSPAQRQAKKRQPSQEDLLKRVREKD